MNSVDLEAISVLLLLPIKADTDVLADEGFEIVRIDSLGEILSNQLTSVLSP